MAGAEGWEANQNERLMRRLFGEDAPSCMALSREDWLGIVEGTKAPILALVVALVNVRKMRAEQLLGYARAFLELCRRAKRRPFLWLSAMMFLRREDERLARALVEEVGTDVERFGWMDGPPLVARGIFSLDRLLERIAAVTPPGRAVMQYNHFAPLTSTPEKVLTYMRRCREHGIDAFAVLAPLQHLSRPPWRDFYRKG